MESLNQSASGTSSFFLSATRRASTPKMKVARTRQSVLVTQQHLVEQFGPQMPVQVAESLASNQGRKRSSVKVSGEYGWGWYVCGRKLLVWHVVPTKETIAPTVISRELLLPSSDLAHTANHVVIFVQPGQKTASCVAISPEGLVRYWQEVGQHSPWVDVNAHLGGEEVCAVEYTPPLGCVAVTTSGSLVVVTPTLDRGLPTVTTSHLSAAHGGWLGGLGKRVSSIIFGMSTSGAVDNRVVKIVTRESDNDSWEVYLLAGLTLQLWLLTDKNRQLLYDISIEDLIRAAFPRKAVQNGDCEIVVTDMRLAEGGLMVLVASSEPRHYVLMELTCLDQNPPTEALVMCILTNKDCGTLEMGTSNSGCVASLRFLLLPATALIFNSKVILAVPIAGKAMDGDRIDIPGGIVLGGDMYKNKPVFFSATYGFLSICPIDTACIDLLNSSSAETLATPSTISSREPPVSTKPDYVSTIKTAFILYIRKNIGQCKHVIEKAFPPEKNTKVDSPFSTTMVKVSLDIINDLPLKDPRWGEKSHTPCLSGVTSLRIETQLMEKLQAHDLFLKFVKDLNLANQLGKVTRQNAEVRTIHILTEHNEKIMATIALRSRQKDFEELIDSAITKAVMVMEFQLTSKLTSQDYFYRYVSIVDEGLRVMVDNCENMAREGLSISKYMKILLATNEIITEVAYAVIRKRERKGYYIDKNYLPWISAPGNKGLYDHLVLLTLLTYELIRDYHEQFADCSNMIMQLFLLSDVILYTQKDYPPLQKFYDLRASLIKYFITLKAYDLAKKLAYKYKDFKLLIEVVYRMNQPEKLYEYMRVFGDEGFCEEVFKWLIAAKRFSELLKLEAPPGHEHKLGLFLRRYPRLNWLYLIREKDFASAANILTEQAINFNKSAIIKQRMLSFGKLLSVVGDNLDNSIEAKVNSQLECLDYQKNLPISALAPFAADLKNVRAFTPYEIIQIIISDENIEADVYHFKNALHLLKFFEEQNVADKLRNKIWAAAVLKDQWIDKNLNAPLEILSNMMFFKLMELVVVTETNPGQFIPSIETLLEIEDLEQLSNNSVFTYLVHYAYEHFSESLNFSPKGSPRDVPA
ncbi:nuclear pore complex protein Nup133 isoform X2 [Rhodnius prolixus]